MKHSGERAAGACISDQTHDEESAKKGDCPWPKLFGASRKVPPDEDSSEPTAMAPEKDFIRAQYGHQADGGQIPAPYTTSKTTFVGSVGLKCAKYVSTVTPGNMSRRSAAARFRSVSCRAFMSSLKGPMVRDLYQAQS